MSEELKPCPFCGGAASIHKGMLAFDDFEVHCDPCGMCGPNFGAVGETLTPKEDAIAAWNTRAVKAEVERDAANALLLEARSDLEVYITNEYPKDQHPYYERQWNRDMELCRRIDAHLGAKP